RDAEVARERQLEPRAHREAVDRGDDRLGAALGRRERVAPALEIRRGQRQELRDIAAGAERLAAGAADHDDAHRIVRVQRAEHAGELVPHRDRHRVHLRLAIDPDRRDGIAALDAQETGHGTRTTLPLFLRSSTYWTAARAFDSGNVRSTTGRSAPFTT